MPPATQDIIVGVNKGLLKSCQSYIQATMYNTGALSIITTTEGTKRFLEDQTEALSMVSQSSPLLDMVAEIYSRAGTGGNFNDMVSLRCGDDLVWWEVEALGHWWLDNTEWQMAPDMGNLCDDKDDDDSNGNSTGSGWVMGANTRKQ